MPKKTNVTPYKRVVDVLAQVQELIWRWARPLVADEYNFDKAMRQKSFVILTAGLVEAAYDIHNLGEQVAGETPILRAVRAVVEAYQKHLLAMLSDMTTDEIANISRFRDQLVHGSFFSKYNIRYTVKTIVAGVPTTETRDMQPDWDKPGITKLSSTDPARTRLTFKEYSFWDIALDAIKTDRLDQMRKVLAEEEADTLPAARKANFLATLEGFANLITNHTAKSSLAEMLPVSGDQPLFVADDIKPPHA